MGTLTLHEFVRGAIIIAVVVLTGVGLTIALLLGWNTHAKVPWRKSLMQAKQFFWQLAKCEVVIYPVCVGMFVAIMVSEWLGMIYLLGAAGIFVWYLFYKYGPNSAIRKGK